MNEDLASQNHKNTVNRLTETLAKAGKQLKLSSFYTSTEFDDDSKALSVTYLYTTEPTKGLRRFVLKIKDEVEARGIIEKYKPTRWVYFPRAAESSRWLAVEGVLPQGIVLVYPGSRSTSVERFNDLYTSTAQTATDQKPNLVYDFRTRLTFPTTEEAKSFYAQKILKGGSFRLENVVYVKDGLDEYRILRGQGVKVVNVPISEYEEKFAHFVIDELDRPPTKCTKIVFRTAGEASFFLTHGGFGNNIEAFASKNAVYIKAPADRYRQEMRNVKVYPITSEEYDSALPDLSKFFDKEYLYYIVHYEGESAQIDFMNDLGGLVVEKKYINSDPSNDWPPQIVKSEAPFESRPVRASITYHPITKDVYEMLRQQV
jgi:hypothetical protein